MVRMVVLISLTHIKLGTIDFECLNLFLLFFREIFTFCAKPYAEFSESEPLGLFKSILKGTRLAKPQMTSIDVYTILLRCWLENPVARPDFKTLAKEFAKMCLNPRRYLSIKV